MEQENICNVQKGGLCAFSYDYCKPGFWDNIRNSLTGQFKAPVKCSKLNDKIIGYVDEEKGVRKLIPTEEVECQR